MHYTIFEFANCIAIFKMEVQEKTSIREDSGANNDASSDQNLSQLFDTGFEMYNNLNKTDEPTNSSKVQVRYILIFV